MKPGSAFSRLVCSPALQGLYSRVRRIPIAGQIAHGIVGGLVPAGSRVTARVRSGHGAGLLLCMDPRYEAQYAAGSHEQALLACLAVRLKPGDVFYDVGAHIGFISLVAGRLVGPQGRVFAFEAEPQNAARIAAHAEMNSMAQVEIVPAAVWSECATLSFGRDSDSSSRNTGSVIRDRDERPTRVLQVRAISLDHFSGENRAPTLIKIDVEGAEEDVLNGAREVFHAARPQLICEVHHAQAAEGVTRLLAAFGYRWNWLGPQEGFPRHLEAQPAPEDFL